MDEHNYRTDATERHDEILGVPADVHEEGQEYEFCNVLWIQRGDDNIFSQRWEDNKPEDTKNTIG